MIVVVLVVVILARVGDKGLGTTDDDDVIEASDVLKVDDDVNEDVTEDADVLEVNDEAVTEDKADGFEVVDDDDDESDPGFVFLVIISANSARVMVCERY